MISENKGISSSFFFLRDLFKVLIDNRDSEQDTCSGTNSTHKVSENGESTNTDTTEGSCGWDVSVEVLDHGVFSLSFDEEFLINELSGDVS